MGDGATPENFTTIANVGDIGGPNITRDQHDATTHDSVARYEDSVLGVIRTGTITFPIHWVPTNGTHDNTTGLLSKLTGADVITNFKEVLPDAVNTSWILPAKVVGFEPSKPVSGILTATITLKPSGQPTLV